MRVLIIGLGNMGMSYDLTDQNTLVPGEERRTHFGVIGTFNHYTLAKVIDLDKSKVRLAKQLSGLELDTGDIDLAVICSSSSSRIESLKTALTYSPKAIIFEKPIAMSMDEINQIETLLSDTDTKVWVNYHRRYDPDFQKVFNEINEIQSINFKYSKGMRNYASHALDLVMTKLGAPKSVQCLSIPESIKGDDPNYSFVLNFDGNIQATFSGVIDPAYDLWELEFQTQSGLYLFRSGGIEKLKSEAKDGAYYRNYKQLTPFQPTNSKLVGGLRHLYKDVWRVFVQGQSFENYAIKKSKQMEMIFQKVEHSYNNENKLVDIES